MTISEPELTSEPKPFISGLEAEFAAIESPEERLRLALDRMRQAISLEGKPDFRTFWDVRNLCIGFFREGIHPAIRSQLWEGLRDITAEARKLRDHLSEQAEFASDQMELAIAALQGEIDAPLNVQEVSLLTLSHPSRRLELRLGFYKTLEQEIVSVTVWANRITALREELVRTEMRVGRKTKLFRQLSALGDRIFPKRKECIQQVSDAFVQDVEAFAQLFASDNWPAPPYVLRDEIRSFQAFAKLLSINSRAFTKSREILSGCWDKVRQREEVRKREEAEKGEMYQANLTLFIERIQTIQKLLEQESESPDRASNIIEDIDAEARLAELGSKERKQLRALLGEVRKLIADRVRLAKEEQARKHRDRLKQSADRASRFQEQLQELSQMMPRDEARAAQQLQALREDLAQADLTGSDRSRLQDKFVELQEQLGRIREDQVVKASEGQGHQKTALDEILHSRRQRRSALKEKIEILRREAGASGRDFASAMATQELLKTERARLSDLDQQIEEVERKLRSLS